VKAFSTLSSLTTLTDSDSEKTRVAVVDDHDDPHRPAQTPLTAHVRRPPVDASEVTVPETPLNAKPKFTTPGKDARTRTPRTSKKALAQAEQAERAAYAQSLFDELNQTVFAAGLPVETTLAWSNRLLTTAGRARWHRCVLMFSSRFGSLILPVIVVKIQGRGADDFYRARDQDPGFQRQVEAQSSEIEHAHLRCVHN
jgi:hypothetical protein